MLCVHVQLALNKIHQTERRLIERLSWARLLRSMMVEEYEERVVSILRGGEGYDEKYCTISEFKQHLNEAGLAHKQVNNGWVLWHRSKLRHKVITLLKHIASLWDGFHYLVQFWAVVKDEKGHHYLSNSSQPFCVDSPWKGGCWFRTHCVDVDVGEGAEAEQLGSLGRAYLNKRPESTPDLRLYSSTEFPLRDHAARCGFRFYLALPLFDFRHQDSCYGVLEVLSVYPRMQMHPLSVLDRGLEVLLYNINYPFFFFNTREDYVHLHV